MIKLDWRKFEIINEKYTDAFQTLCLHLFCQYVNETDYIPADFNQAGLETEPIKFKGKYYGYQSKYFDKNMDYKQIDKSVKLAIKNYHNINAIKIYYNCNARLSTSSTKMELDQFALERDITLEWLGRESFETALNKKENLALCQLFFGIGRELDYFDDVIPKIRKDFLNGKNIIELPVSSLYGQFNTIQSLANDILKDSSINVIKGLPGTGKSVLMEKIFAFFSGCDLVFNDQIKKIVENKFIPILVKLKYCTDTTLEQKIREIKWEYNFNPSHYQFVYLLDGLDEVPSEKAEQMLSYVKELSNYKDTRKIILTIRKASLNNILLNNLLNKENEYIIQQLDSKVIKYFFEQSKDENKIAALRILYKNNEQLLQDIKDVLLLNLLFYNIEKVNQGTKLYDIFSMQIEFLNSNHTSELDEVCLPDPKADSIMKLNKEIAYRMHKDKNFVISRKILYKIIYKLFPKLDYQQVNDITKYILNAFFESGASTDDETFSYQHRRYQEYFYILKLVDLYKNNITNLRKEEIFSNTEFFGEFFLPYIENLFEKEKNLYGLLEVELIKTYLGKNPMWGADRPWYEYSDDFCYAVAMQPEQVFYGMIEDESLDIKKNVVVDYADIIDKVNVVNKSSVGHIPEPLEELIRFDLRSIVIYWKCDKKRFAIQLYENFVNGINFILNNNNKKLIGSVNRAFFEEKYAQIFCALNIQKEALGVRLQKINNTEVREIISSKKTKYVEALEYFYEISFEFHYLEMLEVMEYLSDENLQYLCLFLIKNENLKYLEDKNIKERMLNLLKKCSMNSYLIAAVKQYYYITLTEREQKSIDEKFDELSNERWIDLFGITREYDVAAFLAFVKNHVCTNDKYSRDTRSLYQKLYINYINALRGEISYVKILTSYKINCTNTYFEKYSNITYYTTSIFAQLIKNLTLSYAEKQFLIEKLFDQEFSMGTIHKQLLLKLLKKTKLPDTEKILRNFLPQVVEELDAKNRNEDISDNISQYFITSLLYSGNNQNKSIKYIVRGLNAGIIRHGWRKDGIVDTYLLDALEVIWDKNYIDLEQLIDYSNQYFEMILVLNKITDESYRCYCLERLVGILSRNDLKFCKSIMDEIIKHNLQTNEMVFKFIEQQINVGSDYTQIKQYFEYFDFVNHNAESIVMKLELLLAIFYSDWYGQDIQILIKNDLEKYIESGWFGNDFMWKKKYYDLYVDYCDKNNIMKNVTWIEESEDDSNRNNNAEKFIKRVESCKSKKLLEKLYGELSSYENNIVIIDGNMWEKLVDKTYDIDGNLQILLALFKQWNFPKDTFYTSNSKYLYMPLGYVIKRFGMIEEIWNHIRNNGGYAGFINLFKAYDYAGNSIMCIKLFSRFYEFCELLVFDEFS